VMQASVRAASWIISRTGKKGLESAVLQLVSGRFSLGARRLGPQPVQRQWLCGYGSQAMFKSSSTSAHMCSAVSGGGFDEREVLQGLRDEVRRLKAGDVVRLST
jgi:hypothetical protein